jgi:sugar phosphate permease
MASGGVTAWLITVLHEVKGLDLALASAALAAYMAGSGGGVLLGGWAADKSTRYLAFFVPADHRSRWRSGRQSRADAALPPSG